MAQSKLHPRISPEQADYVVYTDGGCLVNPDGPGGIGVVITRRADGVVTEMHAGYRCTTNNRMEIRAAVTALEFIPKGSSVVLYSDSQYVVKTATGYFRETKNQDLWARLHRAEAGKTICYEWVRGHNGTELNERCDALATLAMRQPDKLEDEGYAGKAQSTGEKKQDVPAHAAPVHAASALPSMSESLNAAPSPLEEEAYSVRYQVHPACAHAICEFYRKGSRSFSAFLSLRTDGLDGWSRKGESDIGAHCGEEAVRVASQVFPNPRDALTCLRWRCRGLRMEDAIRKVQVDREVAMKTRR